MKLILLTTFCCTLLASGLSFTGKYKIESNSFNKEIAKTHSSRIHRRSLGPLFGFNQNLSPIKISITFGNANQQVVPNNQRTWSQPTTSRRPNTQRTWNQPSSYRNNNYPFIQIHKNFYFPNGNYNNNVRRKNQQYPAELRTTTIRPSITTEWPSFESVKTTGKVQVPLEEVPISIAPTPKLMFTTEQTPVVELSTENSVKMQDIPTTTTSRPLFERPTTTTSTTTLAPLITNDISTRYEKETKGGFTSTSEPRSDEFSELIYDIDPRH